MSVDNSRLRTIHLIPWDVGVTVGLDLRRRINYELKRLGWRPWGEGKYCRKGVGIYYFFHSGRLLTLDIFDDGYSIFSIHNHAILLDELNAFDPLTINYEKTKAHKTILEWKHTSSKTLKQVMQSIWYLVSVLHRRISANSSWENCGFSYVFSFYFLRTSSSGLRTKDLNIKFHALLFPNQTSDIDAIPEIDQSYSLQDHTFYENEKTELCTIIKTPHKHTYFSWATSIFAGASSSSDFLAYCRTMREIQHGWFSAYVADQRLNEIVDDLSHIDSVEKLIKLDNQMSHTVRELTKLTSISDSMATNLQLRILRVGVAQSGLIDLTSSMQTKLQFIRSEIASRIDRKNLRSYRSMEAILTLLAFIQAGFCL